MQPSRSSLLYSSFWPSVVIWATNKYLEAKLRTVSAKFYSLERLSAKHVFCEQFAMFPNQTFCLKEPTAVSGKPCGKRTADGVCICRIEENTDIVSTYTD